MEEGMYEWASVHLPSHRLPVRCSYLASLSAQNSQMFRMSSVICAYHGLFAIIGKNICFLEEDAQ